MAKGKKGWGKKKIEKLVPVKKTVSKPDQGTFSQTFYVDPLKKKSKPRKPGKGEDDAGPRKRPKSKETGPRKRPKSKETSSDGKRKIDETGPDEKRKVDETDPDGKRKVDDGADGKKMVPDESHPFQDVKSFEDFGKKGIDPESAKQFFCNM